ncbi:gTPase Era [Firmicutes bacterium CAG:460]|jgi:GTP-binding protein Era|nr:gTPase Era [Firmicutes bacterium CAG:460]
MKSGFVSIIGRPNVGKSTLINTIINRKVAITSNVSGTTRNIIQGIYNDSDTQIVFVDTPGIHKPINRLGKVLNKEALALTKDVDLILFVVDVASGIGKGDMFILESLKNNDVPVILVLNKIDEITTEKLFKTIDEFKDIYPFVEVVPTSGLKNDNVEHLISVIKKYLHDEVKYFPDEYYTSSSMKFMASEIVREKLLQVTEDEIPHSITCITTLFEEKKDIVNISVDIIVDRDNIKRIIIGKNGSRLKTVGTLARTEIESELVGKKVYLELFVKTIKNWKDKEKYLVELGFIDNE